MGRDRADVPEDLEGVVLRWLAKDPAERYPDAEGLDHALGECACAGDWDRERAAWWWQDADADDHELSRPWGGLRAIADHAPTREGLETGIESSHCLVEEGLFLVRAVGVEGTCTRKPLFVSPPEQTVCAIQIRPLQHFTSAIAAPSKSSRLTSRFTAFESACMNGLPLELFGPPSHLPFLLRATVGRHRRVLRGFHWPYVVKKYNVDGATLDRIDKEGAERKWPLPDLD
jgi:hypothetical protein